MPRTAAQSDARIRELEARNRGLAAELSERIAAHDVCVDMVRELREKLERAEIERDVLRRVVRAADALRQIVPVGHDAVGPGVTLSREARIANAYDEARAAIRAGEGKP